MIIFGSKRCWGGGDYHWLLKTEFGFRNNIWSQKKFSPPKKNLGKKEFLIRKKSNQVKQRFCQRIILVKKIVVKKSVGEKKFWNNNFFFGPMKIVFNKIWVKTNFGVLKVFWLRKKGFRIICDWKILWLEKNFDPKKCVHK